MCISWFFCRLSHVQCSLRHVCNTIILYDIRIVSCSFVTIFQPRCYHTLYCNKHVFTQYFDWHSEKLAVQLKLFAVYPSTNIRRVRIELKPKQRKKDTFPKS